MPLDAGDFSLMDRRVVDQLLDFPESDPFLRGLRAWVGFRQTGVDYLRPERAFGRSTHSFLKNFWWAKKAILSFSSRPVEILSYLGIGLTALSLGGLMGVVLDVFVRPEVPHSVVLLAFVVALFGSLNLMAVALTGEYLIRALEQGRGRPRFIRKAIRTGTRHLTSAEDIERFRRLRSRERGHHAPVVRLVEKTNENHGE
jgi:dolichol-phosphate mannosyltransferase